MDKCQSGVYAITNLENDKIYVGSTKDFKERWYIHRRSLNLGTHYNKYLQRSWNKHGEDMFEFSILEYVNNLDDLHLVEQFWMDKYREGGKELYNIGKYADNALRGNTMPEEHRRNIGKSLIGHPVSEESKRKTAAGCARRGRERRDIPFPHLVNKGTGEIMPSGVNLGAMCEEWGLDYYCVLALIRGERSSHRDWTLLVNPRSSKRDRTYPTFIHKETDEVIPAGHNLARLCRKLGIPYSGMNMVKCGKRLSHYGWILKDN